MRRLIALAALILVFGCSPHYAQRQQNESEIMQLYEAIEKPYPFTVPVFVGCRYFRIKGEEQKRPLADLDEYAKGDPGLLDWDPLLIWSESNCKG
jgi:hypothetical protein